jgi:hypothetical protein
MRRTLYLLFTLGFVLQMNAQVIFYVETPAALVGNKEMTWADPAGGWGCPDMNVPANAILDTLVFASDGTASDSLCCSPVTNGASVAGQIAVLYRGTCEFGVKALNAQNAGAIGVVIINNIPGAPVAMGPGAQGLNVTIPVCMITQADGALLKAQIEAGTVTAFFGSKFGFYPNDMGLWPKDFILPPASSNPHKTNQVASEYSVAVGSWIYNFGQNTQTNVRLHGNVSFGGSSIYSQQSSPATITPGDSLWIQLPSFSQGTYNAGLYKFQYSITSDSTDDFPADNVRRADFSISDTLFAYGALDTTTLVPINNATYRPSGSTGEFEVCIHYRDSLSGRLATTGMSFVASTPSTDSLNGIYMETTLYEWNDAFTDVNGTVTFAALNPVIYGGYTYPTNQQDLRVYAPFSAPYTLLDNTRYLFCVKTFDAFVYIGFSTSVDYDEHINTYLQPVGPINDNGTWYWAGFGTDLVPSVSVTMFDKNTLGDESITTVTNGNPPYPNPATNMIYIPLANAMGEMEISILDIQGKLIKSEVRNVTTAGSLPINIEGVSNGQYIVRLSASGKTQSFKILINN